MHPSLNYITPDEVYRVASGGGADIVDKFSKTEKTHSRIEEKTGSAVLLHVKGYPLKLDALLS